VAVASRFSSSSFPSPACFAVPFINRNLPLIERADVTLRFILSRIFATSDPRFRTAFADLILSRCAHVHRGRSPIHPRESPSEETINTTVGHHHQLFIGYLRPSSCDVISADSHDWQNRSRLVPVIRFDVNSEKARDTALSISAR